MALEVVIINRSNDNKYIYILQLQLDTSTQSTARNNAKGFLALLRSKSVVQFMHLLLDVTRILMYLSTDLQKRDCVIGEVQDKLEATLQTLEKYKTR